MGQTVGLWFDSNADVLVKLLRYMILEYDTFIKTMTLIKQTSEMLQNKVRCFLAYPVVFVMVRKECCRSNGYIMI